MKSKLDVHEIILQKRKSEKYTALCTELATGTCD